MHYFTQGLQPHIQSYVTLAHPKSFQEAESLARVKELVGTTQRTTETESIRKETMISKLMTHQPKHSDSKIAAAVSAEPNLSYKDQRFDELSRQVERLQRQNQNRAAPNTFAAVYDQQPNNAGNPYFNQPRVWQGGPNRQIG